MFKLKLAILTIFLISSCGSDKNKDAPSPNPLPEEPISTPEPEKVGPEQEQTLTPITLGVPLPIPENIVSIDDNLLKHMNDACLQATGSQLNKNLECNCPPDNEGNKRILNARKKECVGTAPLQLGSSDYKGCKSYGFANKLKVSPTSFAEECLGLASILFDYEEETENLSTTKIGIKVSPSVSYSKLLTLSNQLDLLPESFFAKAWFGFKTKNSHLNISIGEDFSSFNVPLSHILNTKLPISSLEQQEDYIFTRDIYEPISTNLLKVVDEANLTASDIKEMYPRTNNPNLKYLDDAWRVQGFKDSFPVQWGIALYGKGCESLCRLFRKKITVNGYGALMERVYSKGSLAVQRLWLLDAKEKVKGVVVYGLNNHPVYYIDFKYINENNKVMEHIDVYSRDFTKIHSEEKVLLENSQRDQLKHNSMISYRDLDAGQGIILCEDTDIFDPKHFFKGPYKFDSTNLSGSIFGWNSNVNGDIYQALAGREEVYSPGSFEGTNINHGNEVIASILETYPEIKITASGQCFHAISDINHIVKSDAVNSAIEKQKIKVVNISYAVFGEEEHGCRQRIKERLGRAENKLLLVAGAGNEHIENPDSCPAGYPDFTSLVVTSAENHSRDNPSLLWDAVYGIDRVDIAANYISPNGSEGSSFAAPRVAATGVKIAHKYQNLTPEDIRLAILVSAYIPRNKLPVRSGGVLRTDDAVTVAECFHNNRRFGRDSRGNKNPFTPDEAITCLQEVDRFGYWEARKQVEFLKSRPLIFR